MSSRSRRCSFLKNSATDRSILRETARDRSLSNFCDLRESETERGRFDPRR